MSSRARVTSLALIATMLALIAGPVSAASAAGPGAKWTVMVYMSGDNNLEDQGTAVMAAVDQTVLHRRFTGSKYSMVHGITVTGITRPVERTADWTYYHGLDFAQATGWDEFEDLLAS